jgi:hypothetical protein
MRNIVNYEWDWEENELCTLDGDIIEHWFSKKPEPRPSDKGHYALCLMRAEWNPIDGNCEGQEYLYVEDGILPDKFDNGVPVPVKYRKQFDTFVKNGWLENKKK